jgi:uncharacterized membrane protein (GlpM family)
MQIIVLTLERRKVILHIVVDARNQGMLLKIVEPIFHFFHLLREIILKRNKYNFNRMNPIPLEMFSILPNLLYLNQKMYTLLEQLLKLNKL